MIQASDSGIVYGPYTPSASAPAAVTDDEQLREALKRCSPATREAAREFRRTRNVDHLPAVVHGLIEHYIERGARAKLARSGDSLRLVEDLAIDSLTMLEIVFLAEEVLQISIDNEDLRPFRTVGDVKAFITAKLRGAGSQAGGFPPGQMV